jgi:YVTN family beta-propeller protein
VGATKDGKRIYIACHNANHVAVIDGDTHKVLARIPTDAGPVQVTVTPSQAFAYVANDGAGTVQKIDLATNEIAKTITIAPDAGSHGVGFASGGRWLLITNTGAGTISIIDTEKDEVVKTIPVARAPEGIAVIHKTP